MALGFDLVGVGVPSNASFALGFILTAIGFPVSYAFFKWIGWI